MALQLPELLSSLSPPLRSRSSSTVSPLKPRSLSVASISRSNSIGSLRLRSEDGSRSRSGLVARALVSGYGPGVGDLLGEVSIFTAAGEPVAFKDLWDQEEGIAVVALLRHFGCPCCWELASALKETKSRFEAAGVKLIAVGVGTPDKARILAERLPFPEDCLYADPDRKAYDVLGLYYGLGRTFFNPASTKVFSRFEALKEAVKNYTIEATPEDRSSVLQQGGMFVFKGKELLYARKDEGTGDHASLDDIFNVCCKAPVAAETSEATLMEYFSNFGEIDDCFILIDTTTGCSRGYGFVNFTEPAMADQVLDQQDHYILGRKVDVKSATQRGQSNQTQEHDSNGNGKKIFVGGLPNGLTTYQLRTHFETFGPVDDAVIMHNSSGNPRGFGFVTFSSAPDAEKALQQRFHALSHKTVEVKRAEPREKISYGQPEVHDSYPTAFPSADPYYGYSPYGYYYDPCYGVYWSPYGYYGDYGYGYLVVPANGMGDLSFSAQHIPTENGDCGSSEYDGSTDGVASVSDAALRFDSLMM